MADYLTLSENVSYEKVEILEVLEGMTDPEINGKLRKEKALNNIACRTLFCKGSFIIRNFITKPLLDLFNFSSVSEEFKNIR